MSVCRLGAKVILLSVRSGYRKLTDLRKVRTFYVIITDRTM